MKQLKNLVTVTALRKKVREQEKEIVRLKRLAFYDELSGVLNRRGGTEEMSLITAELRNFKEDGDKRKNNQVRNVVIGFFDIDRFKGINDHFGHDAGDVVIRQTARFLKSKFRDYDIVCRWGGEEFVVAFQGDEWDFLNKTFAFSVKFKKEKISVTLSGGVTNYRRGEKLHEAITRADAATYRAKRTGRNKILVHGQLA